MRLVVNFKAEYLPPLRYPKFWVRASPWLQNLFWGCLATYHLLGGQNLVVSILIVSVAFVSIVRVQCSTDFERILQVQRSLKCWWREGLWRAFMLLAVVLMGLSGVAFGAGWVVLWLVAAFILASFDFVVFGMEIHHLRNVGGQG